MMKKILFILIMLIVALFVFGCAEVSDEELDADLEQMSDEELAALAVADNSALAGNAQFFPGDSKYNKYSGNKKARKIAKEMILVRSVQERKAPTSGCGDLNNDGQINNVDIQIVSEIIIGKRVFTEEQERKADVNSDRVLDSWDISKMTRYVREKEETLNCQFGCRADDECPDDTARYCSSSGDACERTHTFTCEEGACVTRGGGGGCRTCPVGCEDGSCVEFVCEEIDWQTTLPEPFCNSLSEEFQGRFLIGGRFSEDSEARDDVVVTLYHQCQEEYGYDVEMGFVIARDDGVYVPEMVSFKNQLHENNNVIVGTYDSNPAVSIFYGSRDSFEEDVDGPTILLKECNGILAGPPDESRHRYESTSLIVTGLTSEDVQTVAGDYRERFGPEPEFECIDNTDCETREHCLLNRCMNTENKIELYANSDTQYSFIWESNSEIEYDHYIAFAGEEKAEMGERADKKFVTQEILPITRRDTFVVFNSDFNISGVLKYIEFDADDDGSDRLTYTNLGTVSTEERILTDGVGSIRFEGRSVAVRNASAIEDDMDIYVDLTDAPTAFPEQPVLIFTKGNQHIQIQEVDEGVALGILPSDVRRLDQYITMGIVKRGDELTINREEIVGCTWTDSELDPDVMYCEGGEGVMIFDSSGGEGIPEFIYYWE